VARMMQKHNTVGSRKHDAFEKVTLTVGIVTLVAVLMYTAVQVCQTILIRENNEATQRAFVFLKDVRLEQRNDTTFDIVPEWTNTGNSETIDMTAHLNRAINNGPLPDGFNFGDLDPGREVPVVLGPKIISSITFDTIARSCLERFKRREGVTSFYLWGWAQY
jgi:hypothetical protein